MAVETTLVELTDAQWQIADAVARQLVIDGTDVNELRKAISYLRECLNSAQTGEDQAGKSFFDYLKTLVRQGQTIGHSKRTIDYYRSLDDVCSQYLSDYQADAPVLLHLLGWAARLVQYYKDGVPTGEITMPEVMSEREAELKAITAANSFKVGQLLEGVVVVVKGKKVTYELLKSIRLTVKEPRKADVLETGQKVKLEISQLRDDGSIKKVKLVI